jgi:hypothetical protein
MKMWEHLKQYKKFYNPNPYRLQREPNVSKNRNNHLLNLKKGSKQRWLDTEGYLTWKMKMHSIPPKMDNHTSDGAIHTQ